MISRFTNLTTNIVANERTKERTRSFTLFYGNSSTNNGPFSCPHGT